MFCFIVLVPLHPEIRRAGNLKAAAAAAAAASQYSDDGGSNGYFSMHRPK